MKTKLSFLFVLLLVSANILNAQPNTLKFDMKYQVQKNDFVIVNDSLHHRMGLATGSGNALLLDGSNASVKVYFIYDYTGGNGNFAEYDVLMFQDSSTITLQSLGQSIGSVKGKDPLFSAVVTVTGGTGVYDGVTGDGSMSGNRDEALKDGVVVKLSFTVNLKK
jgi:hypothetical protein